LVEAERPRGCPGPGDIGSEDLAGVSTPMGYMVWVVWCGASGRVDAGGGRVCPRFGGILTGVIGDAIRLGRIGIRQLSWGCPTAGPSDALAQNLGEGQGGEGAPNRTQPEHRPGPTQHTPREDRRRETDMTRNDIDRRQTAVTQPEPRLAEVRVTWTAGPARSPPKALLLWWMAPVAARL
jgi:hypothetical protein